MLLFVTSLSAFCRRLQLHNGVHGIGVPNLSQCSCYPKTSAWGSAVQNQRNSAECKKKLIRRKPITSSLILVLHPGDEDASVLPGVKPCLKYKVPSLKRAPSSSQV